MTNALKQPVNSPNGKKPPAQQIRDDKEMHEKISEQELDKTLKDSFPASDPPAH